MNTATGHIATFNTYEDAADAGYTEPLTAAEAKTLSPMNRRQRRKWLAEKRSRKTPGQNRQRSRPRSIH